MTSTVVEGRRDAVDFATFLGLVRDELGCDVIERDADTRLVDDLGWDSLAFFELIGLFERHGLDLPDELVPALRTLGDVHHYFLALPSRDGINGADADGSLRLEVPTQRDFDYLFHLHTAGEHLVRYRLRATTPSPDAFHRMLWEGVTAQFLVRTESGAPVGLVSCFGADFRNRHAHIGVVGDPSWQQSGVLIAGAWKFVGYLFSHFDLRKLYAEVLVSNFGRLATGVGRLFTVEGRLSSHEFVDGGYEDLLVLAIERPRWHEQHTRRTWPTT
jgi:RimJ/RimL family protein N-acetyltransferase/acyl carrier protein